LLNPTPQIAGEVTEKVFNAAKMFPLLAGREIPQIGEC